ncbi:hypothetical protein ABPG74_020828 [Tetrahymena malaccensis]
MISKYEYRNINTNRRDIDFEQEIYQVGFNPYKILDINESQDARNGFYQKISSSNFVQKIWLSLAYDAIQTTKSRYYTLNDNTYFILERSLELYALSGNINEIKKYFVKNQLKNNKFEFDRSILYICCRSGYYDCVKYLLQIGSDVNMQQQHLSTPLHVASFYGHEQVVKLLLSYGSSNKIVNKFQNIPSDEAKYLNLAHLIQTSQDDIITRIFQELKNEGFATSLERMYDDNIIRIYRKGYQREIYFDYYQNKQYERAYHGTKYEFLKSIFIYGLKKPGEVVGNRQVKIRDGHIQAGVSFEGKQNWSDAVFVSPSPFYAADICYSERIVSQSEQYACLVEVFVKNGSFLQAPSTVFKRSINAKGEPSRVEYAIAKSEDKTNIYRIENSLNVVLYSILFIKVKFLEQNSDNYQDCLKQIQLHQIV